MFYFAFSTTAALFGATAPECSFLSQFQRVAMQGCDPAAPATVYKLLGSGLAPQPLLPSDGMLYAPNCIATMLPSPPTTAQTSHSVAARTRLLICSLPPNGSNYISVISRIIAGVAITIATVIISRRNTNEHPAYSMLIEHRNQTLRGTRRS